MKQDLEIAEERRSNQRFRVSVPLTVILDDCQFPAYTRDLSNRGMYFFTASTDGELVKGDFQFLVELPPDITLSASCWILGQAKVIRKENMSRNLTEMGVAAEIVGYSIFRKTRPLD